MLKNKVIIKLLIIFLFYVMTVKVYGYGLVYQGEFIDPTNLESIYRIKILQMANASDESKAEYDRRKQYDGQWIISSGNDSSTTGSTTTFGSFYYAFHPDLQPDNPTYISPPVTSYGSGFASSSSSNNIYYDRSTTPITPSSDSFTTFSGIRSNVPENQGTTMEGFMKLYKDDPLVSKHLQWKVTKSGVRLDLNELTNYAVQQLIERYGQDKLENGIRFSHGLRTKYRNFPSSIAYRKDNMDSAWIFFQLTTGYWYSGVRGFVEYDRWNAYDTGTYNKGASVANEYDNILTLPFKTILAERKVYINHVDVNGNLINGMQKSSQEYVEAGVTKTIANAGANNGFQETYTLKPNQEMRVTENSTPVIGFDEYAFKYGKSATGKTIDEAKGNLTRVVQTWSTPKQFPSPSTSDVLVINLVYELIPPIPVLPKLEIIGRLDFINRDTTYINSTSSSDLDYIPSTEQLTPYAKGAYPYVVRALKYDKTDETGSSSATVTANITYKWDVWTYSHGSAVEIDQPAVPPSPGPPPTPGSPATYKHKHDSTCDWYKSTQTSSMNKSFSYTVPYKHTWYYLLNFKMYRITKLEVYDNDGNLGGTLFGGGTYRITPSTAYEARFNNSRGRINKTLEVSFPSRSYNLPEVYIQQSKPSGGTETSSGTTVSSYSTSLQTATTKINAETHKSASDATSLTITYAYDNEYVELDSTTDMLYRNYKIWSERIDKETDTYVRDLDSTRAGTGRVNGSLINYTSNLMKYMRPLSKLTTDNDFTPNYQTVPENRENGLRLLNGKITYNIVTDSKYNIGTDRFKATDSTYTINSEITVTELDFPEQSKAYKDNDVNKVNVFTPISYGNFELVTTKIVDHTTGAGTATILQRNAEFTITPATSGSTTGGYSLSDTRKFVKGFYFIFDFDIVYNGQTIESYTPIYIAGRNASITAKTTENFGNITAHQITNSVKVIAITTNITNALKEYFDLATMSNYNYMDASINRIRNTSTQNQRGFLTRNDIINDGYHAIYRTLSTKNVGRIFDFAVTDCNDIAFKDVFRKTTYTNVNEPTGIAYYGGFKQLNIYSTEYNDIKNRTDVGGDPQKILPLGPYKHTNTRYVNAPKMGYRISFDLKTTGYMEANNVNNTRRVEITPRYYYISKDGKTFDNNITLYYKSSSGNYLEFLSSGYSIYFKPNDGYRYLRNSSYTDNHTLLSTRLEALNVSNKLILTNKMMSMNNNGFIQAWYGEFKLPNSTIAISNDVYSPNKNINNPYNDGYIGVIFDIKCIDTGGFTISYDTSDKSANSQVNTSQWDYEGFMNFLNPGSPTPGLKYQLEKDMWQIDNTRYQQIKGTVALFDMDNRAANDFE